MLHRNLGVAYSSLGRPEDARKQYDQALEAEPDDENTLKVYVNLLREVRDLDKAWKYAQQLLDADPLDASYYRLAARVRDDKREYEAAFRLLQASLEHCETEADRIIVGTQLSRLAARMKLSESGLG
jgi:tetratricopeptide (TPR) repeat protein